MLSLVVPAASGVADPTRVCTPLAAVLPTVLPAAASYGSEPKLAAAVSPRGLPATSVLLFTTGAGECIMLSLVVPGCLRRS